MSRRRFTSLLYRHRPDNPHYVTEGSKMTQVAPEALRSMVDRSSYDPSLPDADCIGFYIASPHTPHVWTDADIAEAAKRYRYGLPIRVAGPPFDYHADVASIMADWSHHGWPKGCTVCVDIESYDNAAALSVAYWPAMRDLLTQEGLKPALYTSRAFDNLGDGVKFLADWTGTAHPLPGAAIVQWHGGLHAGYDSSTIYDPTLQLVPLQLPAPPHNGGTPVSGYDIETTHDGKGYVVCDAKGEVFAFGTATYHGGLNTLDPPVTDGADGIALTPDDGGYWIVSAKGNVYSFGNAHYFGGPHDPDHSTHTPPAS